MKDEKLFFVEENLFVSLDFLSNEGKMKNDDEKKMFRALLFSREWRQKQQLFVHDFIAHRSRVRVV
jgi:hypothetical protein